MNIVIDINHPAHVHFFKYLIANLESRGHKILVTASLKDVNFNLLNAFNIKYENLGSYGISIYKKFLNILPIDYKMYKIVKNFKPDIFYSIGSIRGAHVSKILKKPSISFEDTENAREQHLLYMPFTTHIFTPNCFLKELGKSQIRYPGYHQLAYLHPRWYKPDDAILRELIWIKMKNSQL